MTPSQIEAQAIRAIDALRRGTNTEDARVEFKRQWPIDCDDSDHGYADAARRIAAHANAARGEPILWIIGVDESTGEISSTGDLEFKDWWDQIKKFFNGPRPIPTDVVVYLDDGELTAISMETNQAPYVIRNPEFGSRKGVRIEREVPWREGTAVRSATHVDLLKLLVPVATLPDVEAIGGNLISEGTYDPVTDSVSARKPGEAVDWKLDLTLYITPHDYQRIVFPIHATRVAFVVDEKASEHRFTLSNRSTVQHIRMDTGRTHSMPYQSTTEDYAVDGPGRIRIEGRCRENAGRTYDSTLQLEVVLAPAGCDRELRRVYDFVRDEETSRGTKTPVYRLASKLREVDTD